MWLTHPAEAYTPPECNGREAWGHRGPVAQYVIPSISLLSWGTNAWSQINLHFRPFQAGVLGPQQGDFVGGQRLF